MRSSRSAFAASAVKISSLLRYPLRKIDFKYIRMLRIDDIIFSFDLLEKKFQCDLPLCLGNCCRYGDSGAPLSNEEKHILDEILEKVKPFLRPEGIAAIEEQGTSMLDSDNDLVTPLIHNEECAYTVLSENIYMCGIEKAWSAGHISFQKPLSCHLFPARVKYYSDFIAVNYTELDMCAPAREKGIADGIYVYEFLKAPLIRAFGKKVYNEICVAAEELRRRQSS